MSRWLRLLVFSLAPLGAAAATSAPAQQALELAGGFEPDPVRITYSVTGVVEAAGWVRGCPGFAGAEPAVSVSLSDANALLHVFAVGVGAAGVVASGPDGIHHCAAVDEFGIAHLRFGQILSGQHRIWPLTAEPGGVVEGTMLVSEIELGTRDVVSYTGLELDPALLPVLAGGGPLEPTAEPAFGRHEMPGADALELAVTLSGAAQAGNFVQGCVGEIEPSRPDATLTLAAREPSLVISSTSDADTTLMVVGPDGAAFCADDDVNYDPLLQISDAIPGDYAIWVGAYGATGVAATLRVARDAPVDIASDESWPPLNPAAEPAFGRHALPLDGSVNVQIVLAGGGTAAAAGPDCAGEIDPSRPDAILSLAAPEEMLWLGASSEAIDATLIVIGPDGTALCNDDHVGINPAVGIPGAGPGDYAVWIGAWSGGPGTSANLTAGREAPAGGGDTGDYGNPFAGQTLTSAAEALIIWLEAMGMTEAISFERMEEVGPEGVILHDVVLSDPSGAEAPVRMARIRLGDLDLVRLAETGMSERFSLAFEEIEYAALAGGAQSQGIALPMLENQPALSLAVSLLPPDGDALRRELRAQVMLEDQIGFTIGARMLWPEHDGPIGPDRLAEVMAESIEIELNDMGFLGAILREAAEQEGQTIEELIAAGLDELSAMLAPLTPGSPRSRLYEVVSARMQELDRPGVVRVRLHTTSPHGMEALLAELVADEADAQAFQLDIDYHSSP